MPLYINGASEASLLDTWEYPPISLPGVPTPDAVYQFDGSADHANDRVGSIDLTISNKRYGITRGLKGMGVSSTATSAQSTGVATAILSTGVISIVIPVMMLDPGGGDQWIIGVGDNGGGADDRINWGVAFYGNYVTINWIQESSGGGIEKTSPYHFVAPGQPMVMGFTRPAAATSVRCFLDGIFATELTSLTAPDGGAAGKLRFATNPQADDGVGAIWTPGAAIWKDELTDAEIVAYMKSVMRKMT